MRKTELDPNCTLPHVFPMSSMVEKTSAESVTVYICTNLRMSGKSCAEQHSKSVMKALQSRADERAIGGERLVHVRPSVCMGYCAQGPNVKIIGGSFHHAVRVEDIDKILDEAQRLGISEAVGR